MTNQIKQITSFVMLFVFSWMLVFLSLVSTSALAGEKIDKSLDFVEEGNIRITNIVGKIEVFGWNKKQVKVEGELSDNNDSFSFERHNNDMHIQMREKPYGQNSSSDQLKIYVPVKSNISFSSPNSNLFLKEQKGTLNVEAVNGNVHVENVQGKIRAEILNGNIVCSNIRGRVELETVNGNIEAKGVNTDNGSFSAVNGDILISGDMNNARFQTVSGKVRLKLRKIENLQLETVAGDVDVEAELADNADLRATSVSGSIRLHFLKDPSARFEIVNHTGGTVLNELSEDEPSNNDFGPGKQLNFSHKGGKARISVSTLHGDIKLGRK